MEAKKVYIVTSGCYSDYGICGVYSTEEAARASMGKVTRDGPWLEEWVLDPEEAERSGYSAYRVLMLRDGTVESVERQSGIHGDMDCNVWERSMAPAFQGKDIQDCLDCRVAARSEEHAVKIANEKRTMKIALNEWPLDKPQKKG